MLSLRGSILLSTFFHVVIFTGLLQSNGLKGKKVVYKPQYQVRLVRPEEVPALSKPEKTKVQKPKPVPKIQKPKKKKVVLPKKKKAPAPKKKVVKKKKATKKPQPKPKDVAPSYQQYDAVTEDALTRMKRVQEKKASKELLAANRAAEAAASRKKEQQREIEYIEYHQQVYNKVKWNWHQPQNFDQQKKDLITVVSITLLPDGRIIEHFIEESSGDQIFDQSVLRAIARSNPLPPPPIGLTRQEYELGLRFYPKQDTP